MTIEVKQIIENFKKQGYVIKNISKPWRSTIGLLKKSSKIFILKIAQINDGTINKISDHSKIVSELKNQALWQLSVNSLIRNKNLPVKIPQVYNSKFNENIGYLLEDYIEGENITEVDKWIDSFVTVLHFFNDIKIDNINLLHPDLSAYEWLVEKIKIWSKEPLEERVINEKQMKIVFNIVYRAKDLLHFGLQHGDFSPSHILDYKYPIFGLIDAEKGGINKAAYYDVAYFYPKIYIQLNKPNSAREFLKKFIERLSEDRDNFSKQFMAILTSRAIGTVRDYVVRDKEFYNKNELDRRREFLNLILKDNINLLL